MRQLAPLEVVQWHIKRGEKFNWEEYDFTKYNYFLDEYGEIHQADNPDYILQIENQEKAKKELKEKLIKYLTENPDKIDATVQKYNKAGIPWKIEVLNEVLGELNEDVPF